MAQFLYYNLIPNGKKIKGCGTHRMGVDLFAEDWGELFKLLENGQIKPITTAKFPLQEIVKAIELLESGQVSGNIVVYTPFYQQNLLVQELEYGVSI